DCRRQRVRERHSPEMMCFLAEAATCGKTAQTADGVAQGEPRCECIAGRKRRHVVFADVPGGSEQRANQAARKNSARLQRVDAEYLARIGGIGRPIIDDVQNFGAENPTQNDNDSQVPSFLAIDPTTLRVAYANP